MNKGDTLRLDLDFIDDEGNPITEGQYSEMELQLNPEKLGTFSMKFLLSKGEIEWDDEANVYYVLVSEEDSMKLPNIIQFQLRCYDDSNGTVISSDVSSFNLGKLLSRKLIGGD